MMHETRITRPLLTPVVRCTCGYEYEARHPGAMGDGAARQARVDHIRANLADHKTVRQMNEEREAGWRAEAEAAGQGQNTRPKLRDLPDGTLFYGTFGGSLRRESYDEVSDTVTTYDVGMNFASEKLRRGTEDGGKPVKVIADKTEYLQNEASWWLGRQVGREEIERLGGRG